MNKKPPELPNIEDATLMACLAPLMEAMHLGDEPVTPLGHIVRSPTVPEGSPRGSPRGSNDNPPPGQTSRPARDAGLPRTLAEWRALSDEDFAAFRMVESFLARTEMELAAAAAEFPKQLGGALARLARLKNRLADQYDSVTAAQTLLRRALAADGRD